MKQNWLILALCLVGCRQDMFDQPRYKAYAESDFFRDGAANRPLPEGTVARGAVLGNSHLVEGTINGAPATTYPFPISAAVLQRGNERFDIFCSPCHGIDGYGEGIIVQRGFLPPPSFHDDRLRGVAEGYIFQVATDGYRMMYGYGDRVSPEDRWAIVAWIRTLQYSRHASIDTLPPALREKLP